MHMYTKMQIYSYNLLIFEYLQHMIGIFVHITEYTTHTLCITYSVMHISAYLLHISVYVSIFQRKNMHMPQCIYMLMSACSIINNRNWQFCR